MTVIGLEAGEAETVNDDLDPAGRYKVDRTIDGASAADYDGLVVPGGCVGADKLRASKDVVAFVRNFFAAGKPVGVICHGPRALDPGRGGCREGSDADLLSLGPPWTSKTPAAPGSTRRFVCDQGLVTSRTPKDLPAFCAKFIEEFAEGVTPTSPAASDGTVSASNVASALRGGREARTTSTASLGD